MTLTEKQKRIEEATPGVKKIIKKYGLRIVLDCIEETEEWGKYQKQIGEHFNKAKKDLRKRGRL